MSRIILDLCGGTGSWSKPYGESSRYTVHLITLPDYDVTKVSIDDRYITFHAQRDSARDKRVPVHEVHGILAAPPCTQFSLANKGTKFSVRPNFAEGMVTVEACERIIRHCMAFGYLKWWALENPVGHLRKFLGRPQYTFEHWWFDEKCWVSKKTDLWGFFKNPVQQVFTRPAHLAAKDDGNSQNWYTPICPPEYAHLNLDRAALRAITPAGFAREFYRANR